MIRGEIEWEFSEDEDGSGSFMATSRAINLIRQHLTRDEIDIALSLYESCMENVGDELLLELDTASTHLQKALANLFYRSRDFHRAAQTCVHLRQWAQAAKAFEAAGDYQQAAEAYLRNNQSDRAAAIYEKLGQFAKAIEIHRQNNDLDKAARVSAASGDSIGAARMWEDAGNRKAASRCLSSVRKNQPGYDEAASMLSTMHRDRTSTVVEPPRAGIVTEAQVPAYRQGEETVDPFAALSGNVFEPRHAQVRAASISNIDEVSRQAATRYVTRMEGYDSLKRLPIFDELSMDEMKDVYHLGAHIDFQSGDVLIEQGQPGQALFIIRAGSVKVCVIDRHEEKTVAEMSAGSYVGEMSLIDDSATSARVIAKEPVQAFVLRCDALRNYLFRHDRVALRIYKSFALTLAQRLRLATNPVAD